MPGTQVDTFLTKSNCFASNHKPVFNSDSSSKSSLSETDRSINTAVTDLNFDRENVQNLSDEANCSNITLIACFRIIKYIINMMFVHGYYTPLSFLRATVISILKILGWIFHGLFHCQAIPELYQLYKAQWFSDE